ncbi:MAG: hypothetical protein ACIAQZ_00370 [Sedimentisphaeraceae bacterium JB056]
MISEVFNSAKPIWLDSPQRVNRYVWLQPSCSVEIREEVTLRVISTVPYRIYVNGQLHSWGPWRGTHKLLFVTEHTIAAHDDNVEIAILAHHAARPSAEMDMISPWLAAECKSSAAETIFATGESWRAVDCQQWQSDVPSSWFLREFSEIFTADSNGIEPKPPVISDIHPVSVLPDCVLYNKAIKAEHGHPPMSDAVEPTYCRAVSLDQLPRVSHDRIDEYSLKVWQRWQSSLGVWYHDILKNGEFVPPDYRPVDLSKLEVDDVHDWGNGAVCYLTDMHKAAATIFDFVCQVSGFIQIRIKCRKSCKIDFVYSYRGIEKKPVSELYGDICDCGSIEFQAGETVWTSFRSYGLRYIVLASDNAGFIDELELKIIPTICNLPAAEVNDCGSDDILSKGMEVSRRTLEICSSDSIFDCPTRERAQWLGDGMLSGQIIAEAFCDTGPIRRLVHAIVADSSAGHFLRAVIPSDFLDKIPVSELLIIEGVCWYAERYEPRAKWLLPFLKQRVETFLQFMSPNGLLDELPGRLFMDWTRDIAIHPLIANKKSFFDKSTISTICPYDFRAPRTLGVNATINANWLRVLRAVGYAFELAGDGDYSSVINDVRQRAESGYTECFWDSENSLIVEQFPAADPSKFPPSELPCYAALAAGLLEQNAADAMIKTCMDPDKSMIRVGSPAGSRYVVEGLLRYGYKELAKKYVELVFGDMIHADGMLWENFTGGNPSHVWGAYSIYLVWNKSNILKDLWNLN